MCLSRWPSRNESNIGRPGELRRPEKEPAAVSPDTIPFQWFCAHYYRRSEAVDWWVPFTEVNRPYDLEFGHRWINGKNAVDERITTA